MKGMARWRFFPIDLPFMRSDRESAIWVKTTFFKGTKQMFVANRGDKCRMLEEEKKEVLRIKLDTALVKVLNMHEVCEL